MDNDNDLSGFILGINVNKEQIKPVLFRLFVQAYSGLNDYPEPVSGRVSLLDLPEIMSMDPELKQDFRASVKRTALHGLLSYLQDRHSTLEVPGMFDESGGNTLDLSRTIRLCGGASTAELGSRYIKFSRLTDKVVKARCSEQKKSYFRTRYPVETRYHPLIQAKKRSTSSF